VKSSCRLPLSYGSTFRGRRFSPALLLGAGAMLTMLLVTSLQAQDSGLQARQVYYKPQTAPKADQNTDPGQKPGDTSPKSTGKRTTGGKKTTKPGNTDPAGNGHTLKVEPPPLGLKYVIEQVQESGDSVPVDPDKIFTTGDRIRLRIEVNSDAYVYLVTKNSAGSWIRLFPEDGEDNHLKAFQSVQVPAPPANPIYFDPPSGAETLLIQVSRTPIGTKQGAAPTVAKAQIDDMLHTEQRLQGRDLTRGKVHPVDNPSPDDKNEWAIYTVNVNPDPGSQVVQKFELRHK